MEKKSNFAKFKAWLTKPRKVSLSQKIFFVQQLGVMLKAGISLSSALQTITEQTTSKSFKTILSDLQHSVEKGTLLSKSLEQYEKIFGHLFINMIKAGESSGKLEEVLGELFIQMKKDHDILAKVKGALIYPIIVVGMMVAIGVLMMIFVIPALTGVFEEMNVTLPLPTRILMFISEFFITYGVYVVVAGVVAMIAAQRFFSLPRGKKILHRVYLALPIIGPISKKINLARFCRTLSSLLKTDIPIVQSFEITADVLGNMSYKQALMTAKEKIKKGVSIKESLSSAKNLFPPVVLQMIAVGEETGALDNILVESAIFYEDDVSQTMTNLPSIIEPLMMIAIGIAVGAMAVAVIMPIYTLSEAI